MIYIAPHLSLAVAAWILQALIGIALSVYATWDADQEIRARKASGLNGPLARTGRILRRSPIAKLNAHLIFLLLGLLSLTNPDPPHSLRAALAQWAFVLIQAPMILIQALNARDRRIVRQETRQLIDAPPAAVPDSHP